MMGKNKIPLYLLSLLLLLPSCWQEEQPAEQREEQSAQQQKEPSRSISKSIHLEDIVSNTNEAPDILRNQIAQGKTVVDFYAQWCGPCKLMSPVIDELAKKYEDITFIKIDIDKFNDLSNGFDVDGQRIIISGIPTIYFFKDGKIVEKVGGYIRKEVFEKMIINKLGL